MTASRVFAMLFILLLAGASAATVTWVGATGSWQTASNWSPATVPTTGDAVVLQGTTCVIVSSAAVTVTSIAVTSACRLNSSSSLTATTMTLTSDLDLKFAGSVSFNVVDGVASLIMSSVSPSTVVMRNVTVNALEMYGLMAVSVLPAGNFAPVTIVTGGQVLLQANSPIAVGTWRIFPLGQIGVNTSTQTISTEAVVFDAAGVLRLATTSSAISTGLVTGPASAVGVVAVVCSGAATVTTKAFSGGATLSFDASAGPGINWNQAQPFTQPLTLVGGIVTFGRATTVSDYTCRGGKLQSANFLFTATSTVKVQGHSEISVGSASIDMAYAGTVTFDTSSLTNFKLSGAGSIKVGTVMSVLPQTGLVWAIPTGAVTLFTQPFQSSAKLLLSSATTASLVWSPSAAWTGGLGVGWSTWSVVAAVRPDWIEMTDSTLDSTTYAFSPRNSASCGGACSIITGNAPLDLSAGNVILGNRAVFSLVTSTGSVAVGNVVCYAGDALGTIKFAPNGNSQVNVTTGTFSCGHGVAVGGSAGSSVFWTPSGSYEGPLSVSSPLEFRAPVNTNWGLNVTSQLRTSAPIRVVTDAGNIVMFGGVNMTGRAPLTLTTRAGAISTGAVFNAAGTTTSSLVTISATGTLPCDVSTGPFAPVVNLTFTGSSPLRWNPDPASPFTSPVTLAGSGPVSFTRSLLNLTSLSMAHGAALNGVADVSLKVSRLFLCGGNCNVTALGAGTIDFSSSGTALAATGNQLNLVLSTNSGQLMTGAVSAALGGSVRLTATAYTTVRTGTTPRSVRVYLDAPAGMLWTSPFADSELRGYLNFIASP